MLSVLGVIDSPNGATLTQIAATTGLDRKTVFDLIEKAADQADVRIEKIDSNYILKDLGPTFKDKGVSAAWRMLAVLNALFGMGSATAAQIKAQTGLEKNIIVELLNKAVDQAGVKIEKVGEKYSITDLGPTFRKKM